MTLFRRFNTIYFNTGSTLAIGLFVYTLLSILIVYYFILSPMADRAADDMATIMENISESWVSASNEEKKVLQNHFRDYHDLFISDKNIPVTDVIDFYPFIPKLEKALQRHTGQNIIIKRSLEQNFCFWVTIIKANQPIKIGFFHERFGPHPPKAMLGIIISGCLLILVTTVLLVRRISRPVKNLSNATSELHSGQLSIQIPETGPTELAMLARSFNNMAAKLSQLITNRNTLFGGISHDLRTPITRMQIALELLQEQTDSTLLEGMKKNLNEMEELIQQTMQLVKGMDKQNLIEIKITDVIKSMISEYQKQHRIIQWQEEECGLCKIEVNTFRRVLTNLLDNAFQYGNGQPVSLSCSKENQQLLIRILDKGPGIPADKREAVFQPFFRMDNSRDKRTGGSGLGLAIVRQLCDFHHWKIQLLNVETGGLEVRLEIPLPL